MEFRYTGVETIPENTTILDCSCTQITSLPSLPAGLLALDCHNTQIRNLPALLPQGLRRLECYNNQITELPELPLGLHELICFNTQITGLPELPKNLQIFDFWRTKIINLPSKIVQFIERKEHSKYNKWLQNIKMFQCMYKKKFLLKKRKTIANWIYIQGSRPGKVFARMAIERAKERFRNKN